MCSEEKCDFSKKVVAAPVNHKYFIKQLNSTTFLGKLEREA